MQTPEKKLNGEKSWALCDQDSYLSQHRNDLFVLLNLIKETAERVNFDDYSVPLTKVLYSSSVTGISSGSSQESVDRYALISKLHSGVLNLLDKKRPDVQLQTKRNTGNGGFRLKIGDKEYHVKFSIEQDNDSVSCIVHLPTYLPKPNHVAGKNVKELFESSAYSDAFNKFSKAVVPFKREILLVVPSLPRRNGAVWFFQGYFAELGGTRLSSRGYVLRSWLQVLFPECRQFWTTWSLGYYC